jgi:hypothetical protein
MAWTIPGGQAILTIRSLIQSDRWSAAWKLLQADFRKEVKTLPKHPVSPNIPTQIPTLLMRPTGHCPFIPFANLPLAA